MGRLLRRLCGRLRANVVLHDHLVTVAGGLCDVCVLVGVDRLAAQRADGKVVHGQAANKRELMKNRVCSVAPLVKPTRAKRVLGAWTISAY
jgi:hypothetical protein